MTKLGIGSSPRRREDQRLVTGAGTFGDDFTLPGQTFAAIARSPHAHAILLSIETTKARELPGVLAVLTAADYLADGLKPLLLAVHSQSARHNPGQPRRKARLRGAALPACP